MHCLPQKPSHRPQPSGLQPATSVPHTCTDVRLKSTVPAKLPTSHHSVNTASYISWLTFSKATCRFITRGKLIANILRIPAPLPSRASGESLLPLQKPKAFHSS